ncbi:uncharacterized protein LOC132705649 [Cylas formicarius]|uniref:uncharacterized protein LOC132705649 n=1 Tax=Cylas formicarius TaxID=197179 RepID=UPI002958B49C|nr:uncharacterized protein LOC132705649 [Cylas formicarius]
MRLDWHKLNNSQLEKLWSWDLEVNVIHLNVFKIGGKDFLMMLVGKDNRSSAIIYQFDWSFTQYWFHQEIELTDFSNSSALVQFEDSFYLAVPQKSVSVLQIYEFIENHFTWSWNVISPFVDQVVSFEIGFKSFIAFNGLNAGIYQFTKHGLVEEKLINSNLERIEYWLPIPVKTYRDETILLTQRRLDHGTHHSFDVDIISYNGNKFDEHEDVPCVFFGELQTGLKCLTEYESKRGIIGAAFIAVGNMVGVILPRCNEGVSLLFVVRASIKSLPHAWKNEMEKFLELQSRLQDVMDAQKKELSDLKLSGVPKFAAEATASIQLRPADLMVKQRVPVRLEFSHLADEIKQLTRELEKVKLEFGSTAARFENITNTNLIFNNYVEIKEKVITEKLYAENIGEEEADWLLADLVRKHNIHHISVPKSFVSLSTHDVEFQNINGISSQQLLVKDNEDLVIEGNVTFNGLVIASTLEVSSGTVNDIRMDREWIDVSKLLNDTVELEEVEVESFSADQINDKQAHFKNIEILDFENSRKILNISDRDSVFIPGNVTVVNINDRSFEEFLQKLCITSLKCYLPELKVLGNVNITGNAIVEYLNRVKFPEDYVSTRSSEDVINVSGKKIFLHGVRGYKVQTRSTIDGIEIDPDQCIILSTNQNITGNITFNELEVGSNLEVKGEVKGEEVANFLTNRGLTDTHRIKSNVEFYDLEVEGKIVIGNGLNGVDLANALEDLLYQQNEEISIAAAKIFSEGFTVLKNLNIKSDAINDALLMDIITKNTDQDLYVNEIFGDVNFENLTVNGFFDGKNIVTLNHSIVKVNVDANVSSQLIFSENLFVEELEITEKLNDLAPEEYLYELPDEGLEENIKYIEVDNLVVEGNFTGEMGLNIEPILENGLSLTKDQTVNSTYVIKKSSISNLKVENINGMKFDELFGCVHIEDELIRAIELGNMNFQNVSVSGPLIIHNINNEDFEQRLYSFWKNLHSNDTDLNLQGNVHFQSLEIENIGGVNFKEYIKGVVFKDDEVLELEDRVRFTDQVRVHKLLETNKINSVGVKHILRKEGRQSIAGELVIYGDVIVEGDLELRGALNGVHINDFLTNFDLQGAMVTIPGEVMFNRLPYIGNLNVNGSVNGHNFEELRNSFVYLDGDFSLDGNIVFENQVDILGNLSVTNHINGVNLSDLEERIIWINQDDSIEGPVQFAESVEIYNFLKVRGNLETNLLMGENFEDHLNSAIFLDRGILKGRYTFNEVVINQFLKTDYINDINMSAIVPLKTDQTIKQELRFNELKVVNDVCVKGKVNDKHLEDEYNRTFLANRDQDIASEVEFTGNVIIYENLKAPVINGKSSSKIVSTNGSQNLTAEYQFEEKIWTNKVFEVSGLINGVNFTRWANNSVKLYAQSVQKVNDEWSITDNLTFLGNLNQSELLINGRNFSQLVNDIKERKNYEYHTNKGILKDYNNLCADVSYLYEKAKNQIYKFKYFDEMQRLTFYDRIQYVKFFDHRDNRYLLVNGNNCISDLLKFDAKYFKIVKKLHTGSVEQAEVVQSDEQLFLVTNIGQSNTQCKLENTTAIWKLQDESLEFVETIEKQELLQESFLPLTFYGLKDGLIGEYRIHPNSLIAVRPRRRWEVNTDNIAFMPRGLGKVISLRTGKSLIYLDDSNIEEIEYADPNLEIVSVGNYSEKRNLFVPGRNGGDIVVLRVGIKGSKKDLLAVASHRETKVGHRLDLIEIYDDPFAEELFDKISCYKPSALTAVDFGNGETLLVFMEDNKVLQIYEYKGIEGFKHKAAIKMAGHSLFLMTLPIEPYLNPRKVLGLVHKKEVILLNAIMLGNRINGNLKC